MGIAMKDFKEFAFETSLERQEFAKQRRGYGENAKRRNSTSRRL